MKKVPGNVDGETNCLIKWIIPDWEKPLEIYGWGCEVGNWFGFFAHERLGGISCKIKKIKSSESTINPIRSEWNISLPKAFLKISLADNWVRENKIIRELKLKNIKDNFSWLGDMVLRMVIPWERDLVAKVNDTIIQHENKNFYYDSEKKDVLLKWSDGRTLTVKFKGNHKIPPVFTRYLYVRDQPAYPELGFKYCKKRSWVLHARYLVDYPAAYVYRYARNPFILWDRDGMGKHLISLSKLKERWRAAEFRKEGRGSLYGLWPLKPLEECSFSIEIEARDRKL